jgi:hypothetical protein
MEPMKLITSQKNEIEIEGIPGLEKTLIELRGREPQIALLEMPSFGIFTVGIGPQYGFLEYMDNSRKPPYLLAKSNKMSPINSDFLVFDAGGTQTQIPSIKCIPTNLVIQILIDIIKHNGLPDYVLWEEV